MSSVVISGDTSGAVTVTVPAVAGTNTITLPAVTGTAVIGSSAVSAAGQIPFSTDGTSYTPTAKIVSGTAVASTSGTSIDFTSIPSWVKRITVMFNGVSTSGTSLQLIQIGNGSVVTTGYDSTTSLLYSSITISSSTAGFAFYSNQAASVYSGQLFLTLVSGNIWVASGVISNSAGTSFTSTTAGRITLGGALDRVRITTVNGTDTFDAGSINILYE
jgi:hypothetical protein